MGDRTEHSAAAQPKRRVWPLFYCLILAAGSLLLHLGKAHSQKELLTITQRSSSVVRDRPVEKVKAQRSQFYAIQYYLNYPSAASYAAANFVCRLSAALPLHQVRDLQIDPGLQNFSFRLTVGIAAGGPEPAQLTAARYLESMRQFPEIMQLSLAKADPFPGSGAGNRVYFFSITGQAEM